MNERSWRNPDMYLTVKKKRVFPVYLTLARLPLHGNYFLDFYRIIFLHLKVFWTLSIFCEGSKSVRAKCFWQTFFLQFFLCNAETECFLTVSNTRGSVLQSKSQKNFLCPSNRAPLSIPIISSPRTMPGYQVAAQSYQVKLCITICKDRR